MVLVVHYDTDSDSTIFHHTGMKRGLLRVAVVLFRPTVTLYRLQLGLSNGNVPHMDRTLELDKREKLLSAAVLRKLCGCVVDDVGAKTA